MVVILTGGKLLDNVGLDGLGLIMIVKGPLGGGGGGGGGRGNGGQQILLYHKFNF